MTNTPPRPSYDPELARQHAQNDKRQPKKAYVVPVVQWTIASVMFWKVDKTKKKQ